MKKPKNLDLSTFGGRLSWARMSARLTQKDVCQEIGISQPTLSELEGVASSGSSHTAEFARIYRVSALWLATGKGKPESTEGIEMQEKFNRLDPGKRKLVEQLIDGFLEG